MLNATWSLSLCPEPQKHGQLTGALRAKSFATGTCLWKSNVRSFVLQWYLFLSGGQDLGRCSASRSILSIQEPYGTFIDCFYPREIVMGHFCIPIMTYLPSCQSNTQMNCSMKPDVATMEPWLQMHPSNYGRSSHSTLTASPATGKLSNGCGRPSPEIKSSLISPNGKYGRMPLNTNRHFGRDLSKTREDDTFGIDLELGMWTAGSRDWCVHSRPTICCPWPSLLKVKATAAFLVTLVFGRNVNGSSTLSSSMDSCQDMAKLPRADTVLNAPSFTAAKPLCTTIFDTVPVAVPTFGHWRIRTFLSLTMLSMLILNVLGFRSCIMKSFRLHLCLFQTVNLLLLTYNKPCSCSCQRRMNRTWLIR